MVRIQCLCVCGLLMGCAVGAAGDSDAARIEDFHLRARVLESLEGGPLTVQATLSYSGERPVEIFRDLIFHTADVTVPPEWPGRIGWYGGCGDGSGAYRLMPGGEVSETLHLHHDSQNIPSGRAKIRVGWSVCLSRTQKPRGKDTQRRGAPIGRLITELEIDVRPATPERLAALRRRLERCVEQRDLSYDDRMGLNWDVLETGHPALAPVAMRMIEAPKDGDRTPDLMDFVADCPQICPDFDLRLARLIIDPSWPASRYAFRHWNRRGVRLPPEAWKILTEADSVWTRALTYAVFAKRCDKAWKDSLFLDLRDQSRPLPDSHFNGLLADLDSDDFDVRERASARLVRFGERAEAGLRRALDGPLSVEARRRVAAALEQIGEAKQPPDCVQALGYFGSHDAPEDGELLRVLADGEPGTWLTQQAKDKLAEWRKARGNTEK